ncbi:MAG: phospholipase D-like domain-containing protein [Granulicella sp.]
MHVEALIFIAVPTALAALAVACISVVALMVVGGLFAPSPLYRVRSSETLQNASKEFLCLLEALTDATASRHSSYEVLTNGDQFYASELEAIRAAEKSVNFQAYIFDPGEVGQKYIDAFAERARAGVQVNIVCDSFGSRGATHKYFARVIQSGGKVCWYNTPRWYRIAQIDNRNHRELMVVDGRIGFIGGAGVADWWYKSRGSGNRWRDMMVKVEGDAVNHMQSCFAATWLEVYGEVLASPDYFQAGLKQDTNSPALLVSSTPTNGGSMRIRMLFLMLIASAAKTIDINTPYFLPDKHTIEALVRAVKERNVQVTIIVPGKKSDHLLTQSASRRLYGPLLEAGARIYEYQPSMIHAKIMRIDNLWSIVGSTNLDHRSFGINDEINMAVRGDAFSERLARDFEKDLLYSHELGYEHWLKRPYLERITEYLGWFIQQQQ